MEKELIIHKKEILYDVENTLTKLTRTRQEANPGYNYNEINPNEGEMDRGLLLRSIEHSFDKAVGRVEAYVTGVSLLNPEEKPSPKSVQFDTIEEVVKNVGNAYMLHESVRIHKRYKGNVFMVTFYQCSNMMLVGLPTDGSWSLSFCHEENGVSKVITSKIHTNADERYSTYGNVNKIILMPTNGDPNEFYIADFVATSDSLHSFYINDLTGYPDLQKLSGISYDVKNYLSAFSKEGEVDRAQTTTYHIRHNDRLWIQDTEAMSQQGDNRYSDLLRYKYSNDNSGYYQDVEGYISRVYCSYQVEEVELTLPSHVDVVIHNVRAEALKEKEPEFATFSLDMTDNVFIRAINGKAGYLMLSADGNEISPAINEYYVENNNNGSRAGFVTIGQEVFVPIYNDDYTGISLSSAYHHNPVKVSTSLPIEYSYDRKQWTKVDPYGDSGKADGYERECNQFPSDERDWVIVMDLPDCISKSVPYLIDTLHRYITFKALFEYLMVSLPSEASPYLQLSEDCYKELKRIVSTRKAGLKRPPQPFERN